ncbi:MAG TPA: TetR/AcrR family transcriptional regulator [Nitrospirota bacterium]|nr:TetR/AcrR family transcriptional regulator [Nitrospirota bacterium]
MNAVRLTSRLTADERRQSIINAVIGLFAEKGFDGTTTRELAQAAGISEALLFKHFPSKHSLYVAVLEACALEPGYAELVSNRILSRGPSSSTLVLMIHFMMTHFIKGPDANKSGMERLAVQSLLSDGEFLRMSISNVADTWVRKFEDCLTAAADAGDLRETPVRSNLRLWFAHHIAFSLMLHLRLPSVPAIDYQVSKDELIEQASWFTLMGLGMKEEAIKRLYDVKSIA